MRQRQADARERARLTAVADGRSPTQRAALVAKRAAKARPIEDYDLVRAERGAEYLRNLPDDDETADS